MKLLLFEFALEVYKMKFRLLDYSVEYVREFEGVSILDASAHEQFSVRIKSASQGSLRRRADCMHETVMTVERK